LVIEDIRGELSQLFGKEVSRDIIGQLRALHFIAAGPRSPQPGARYTYVTTKQFLSHFDFDTLRDLPDMEQLEEAGLLSKQKLLAGALPGDLSETPDLINIEERQGGLGGGGTAPRTLLRRFVNSMTAFVDACPLAAPSEAMDMLGLSRALLTFLIALITSQFVGLAWAESATDRPFFVRWALSGNNQSILSVHSADAQTGWAVGTGGTILATRDGGTSWEPQKSETEHNLFGVHFVDAHTGWAVGTGGTILATRDGGIQMPHMISRIKIGQLDRMYL
jgi:Segregation and condensation complex subunit ScpB/Photosynthesis system II assembly factor YCF48